LPLLVPRLIPIGAHVFHSAADAVHVPVDAPASTSGQFYWGIDYGSSEDLSAFGALGGPLLLLSSIWWLVRSRRIDQRWLFAAALPLYLVLLALTSKYNSFLVRFLILPASLAAPLLAGLARRRALALSVTAVAVLELALVHVHNQQKPLTSSPRPWNMTQGQAMLRTFRPGYATAVVRLDRLVPHSACITAAVRDDDPTMLLYGSHLQRRIRFVKSGATITAGAPAGGGRVPLTPGPDPFWTLAVSRAPGCA
jgi:hypothetical protein